MSRDFWIGYLVGCIGPLIVGAIIDRWLGIKRIAVNRDAGDRPR